MYTLFVNSRMLFVNVLVSLSYPFNKVGFVSVATSVQAKLSRPLESFKKAYLPGTEETVIIKAVPPGRGSPLHSGVADSCDYPKCG